MKLSIITINYNNATGLENTLQSVINSKPTSCEYIVIDGGSTDGSVEIIEKYKEKIDYWVSEPDKGIFNAMNKGIAHAKGKYLLFMNSGDIIKDTANMNEIVEELNTGEDIVSFEIDIRGENIEYTKTNPPKTDFLFFVNDSLPHQSTFIKKQTLVDYGGYDENMKISSDWAFFIDAICKNNCSCKCVKKSFSIFSADGLSVVDEYREKSLSERESHINKNYAQYLSLLNKFNENKNILHKLRMAVSIDLIKKLGFLNWFGTYKQPIK